MSVSEDFERQTIPFQHELLAHCYQMLGSVHDAEDLVQETLLRAWRAYDRFDDQRASMRTWLYRIATNACLTALESRGRRPLPSGLGAPSEDPKAPLVQGQEVPWVEPIPDQLLGTTSADPAAVILARGQLRLAMIAAMQLLPARQRAILIMREVLEWPAADVAAALDTTPAAVNSGLQRARARLGGLGIGEDQVDEPATADQRALVDRYVTAFVDADLRTLAGLLTDDVVLEMPPVLNWYTGRENYVQIMALAFEMRGTDWRMLQVAANGTQAVAAYVRAGAGYEMQSLQVFSVTESGIARNVRYVDPAVFATFDVPSGWPQTSGEFVTTDVIGSSHLGALLQDSVTYARTTVRAVTSAELSHPTPCGEWDLRALLNHLNDSLLTLSTACRTGIVRLEHCSPADGQVDGPLAAFDRYSELVLTDGLRHRARRCVLVADLPLAEHLLVAAGAIEISVHGWDVGQAARRADSLPDELAIGLLTIAPLVVDDSCRSPQFGPIVAVPPASGPATRLLAYLGRQQAETTRLCPRWAMPMS